MRLTSAAAQVIGDGKNVLYPLVRQLQTVCSNGR